MSHLRSVLTCLVLLVSLCQAKTGGLRASSGTQGKGLLSNAMVGLSAVAGFLFIVFILLIIKRLFFNKDKDDEESNPVVCAAYENKALEVETAELTKTTNM